MKVAVLQLNSSSSKSNNIKKVLQWIQIAAKQKAKFIVLPEVFIFRGDFSEKHHLADIVDSVGGDITQQLSKSAKENNISILAGSIYEKSRKSDKAYNTSILFDNHGVIVTKYRKIHLFQAQVDGLVVDESLRLKAGKKLVVAPIEGFNIGLSICYDLRFPHMFKHLKRKGAEVFCVPSAFTKKTGQAHWEVLLRARAIENLCYVLAPNQILDNGRGVVDYGHSMIIDPWGKVLVEASADKEEIIYTEISKEVLLECRRKLPAV